MSDALKGKNAVVTGGVGGIGSWVCKALGSAGANDAMNKTKGTGRCYRKI